MVLQGPPIYDADLRLPPIALLLLLSITMIKSAPFPSFELLEDGGELFKTRFFEET